MQLLSTASVAAQPLGAVVGRRPAGAAQRLQPSTRQARRSALTAAAAQRQEAAPSSSAGAAGGSPAAAATLLQRLVAGGSLADRSTLLLAAALGGALLLGAAEPAAAADGSTQLAHVAQPLGDLAENADFWGNVLRYVSYFFSVLLGTAYIAIRPIIELLKRPGTAVLVVAGIAGLVYFVSFTVQASIGLMEGLCT